MITMDLFLLLAAGTATYVIYRAFKSPSIKLGGPQTVAYIIPWLGSALQFAQDAVRFFEQCKRQYGPIYRILVAGTGIVVVADATAIAELERDVTKSLSKEDLIDRALHVITGVKGEAGMHEAMNNKIFPLIAKAFSQTAKATHFLQVLDRELVAQLIKMGSSSHSTILKLLEFATRPFYFSTCIALFGPTFPCEETFLDFKLLDSKFNHLNSGIPFVAMDARRARNRVFAQIVQFIEPWWDSGGSEEIPGISELAFDWLQELKAHRLSKTQAVAVLIFVLWGSQTNVWDMSFWLLHHLAHDPISQERLRREVEEFREIRGEGDIVLDTSHTPLITSAMTETLRWVSKTGVVRRVIKDTQVVIDAHITHIPRGEIILADVGAVHCDSKIYPSPEKFDIDRFLLSGVPQRPVQPYPMAWGGGAHFCKGKSLGLLQMRQLVIHTLRLYTVKILTFGVEEVKLEPGRKKAVVGSLRGAAGSESICIELTLRKK